MEIVWFNLLMTTVVPLCGFIIVPAIVIYYSLHKKNLKSEKFESKANIEEVVTKTDASPIDKKIDWVVVVSVALKWFGTTAIIVFLFLFISFFALTNFVVFARSAVAEIVKYSFFSYAIIGMGYFIPWHFSEKKSIKDKGIIEIYKKFKKELKVRSLIMGAVFIALYFYNIYLSKG